MKNFSGLRFVVGNVFDIMRLVFVLMMVMVLLRMLVKVSGISEWLVGIFVWCDRFEMIGKKMVVVVVLEVSELMFVIVFSIVCSIVLVLWVCWVSVCLIYLMIFVCSSICVRMNSEVRVSIVLLLKFVKVFLGFRSLNSSSVESSFSVVMFIGSYLVVNRMSVIMNRISKMVMGFMWVFCGGKELGYK